MEYTIEQLKAAAYDRMALIQNTTNELNQINKAIEEKMKEPTQPVEETPVEETKKEETKAID